MSKEVAKIGPHQQPSYHLENATDEITKITALAREVAKKTDKTLVENQAAKTAFNRLVEALDTSQIIDNIRCQWYSLPDAERKLELQKGGPRMHGIKFLINAGLLSEDTPIEYQPLLGSGSKAILRVGGFFFKQIALIEAIIQSLEVVGGIEDMVAAKVRGALAENDAVREAYTMAFAAKKAKNEKLNLN